MLSNISHYEFTNAAAPVSGTGCHFGDSMCPRLEEREWLNEVVRTAEYRAQFQMKKKTAAYPSSLGGRDTIATMLPARSEIEDVVSRMNAVMTVPYYDISSRSFANCPTTWASVQQSNAEGLFPATPVMSASTAASILEDYRTIPGGVSYTPGMVPDRDFVSLVRAHAQHYWCAGLDRSNILEIPFDLRNGLNVNDGGWYCDGAAGAAPESDANHFPRMYHRRWNTGVTHPTTCYFRAAWTHPNYSTLGYQWLEWNKTYSYEGDWYYKIPNPGWQHSYDAASLTAVDILVLWRITHVAIWAYDEDECVDDAACNIRMVLTPFKGGVRTFNSWRDHATGILSFSLGNYSTIKEIGDAICSTYGVANLPGTAPFTTMPGYDPQVIGYEAYVDPILMITRGAAKFRDINY